MATRIKLRSDIAANWAATNPILAAGEIGLVIEGVLRRAKVGDGATPWNALDWAFEAEGGGGGAMAFAALTDAATADLPWINAPLAAALAAKLPAAAADEGASPSTLVLRDGVGRIEATAVIATGGTSSLSSLTTAGHVSLLKSGSSDLFSFDFLNVYFAPGSAIEFRTKLGSGATGDALFQAASPAAARETLGIIRRAMASDALATSATPVSAPDLTFPLEAGKLYRVDLNLIVQSVGAVGYQVTVTYPTNARTGVGFSQTIHNSTAKFPNLGATSTTLNPNTTGNPNATIGVSGWVYLRPTASGNVTFSAAQQTGGTGTVGLLTGSMITVTEL